jgi:hypothetical protein
MKRSVTSAFLLAFLAPSFLLFAQRTDEGKTIRKSLSRMLWEVYQVSPESKKVKDGTYEVLTDDKQLLVKGQYKDGKKVGIWEYYSSGNPVQRFDYNAGQLVYNADDQSTMVKSEYSLEAITDDHDTISPPYKIGGINYGFFLLYDPRDIPEDVKKVTSNVLMTYVLTISEEGKLVDWTVMYKGSNVAEAATKQNIYHLPEDAYTFIPAKVNGKPVRSKLTYVVPLSVDHTVEMGGTNGNATKHQGVQ